jgi:hypothetical protein
MNQQNPQNADPADKPLPVLPKEHRGHGEALVDEAVAETLPASDPISPYTPQSGKPVALDDEQRRSSEPGKRWDGWTSSEDAERHQRNSNKDKPR